MAEWSIAADCKSAGLRPTGVQIPPCAHKTVCPRMRKYSGLTVLLLVGDLNGGGGRQEEQSECLSPSRVQRYLANEE